MALAVPLARALQLQGDAGRLLLRRALAEGGAAAVRAVVALGCARLLDGDETIPTTPASKIAVLAT